MEDKLVFFKRSADKPLPRGVHEHLNDSSKYYVLNTIPNWRRIFCSMWSEENFIYDNYTFRSVDHALQYAKFKHSSYCDIANLFTVESNSNIGTSDGLIAYRNRKIVILSNEQIESWHNIVRQIKFDIYCCKYSQIKIAKNALLNTNNAEIWNIGPRIKPIRCTTLEKVRQWLINLN